MELGTCGTLRMLHGGFLRLKYITTSIPVCLAAVAHITEQAKTK